MKQNSKQEIIQEQEQLITEFENKFGYRIQAYGLKLYLNGGNRIPYPVTNCFI